MKKIIILAILLSVSINIFAQNTEPEPVVIPLLYGNSNITIDNYFP